MPPRKAKPAQPSLLDPVQTPAPVPAETPPAAAVAREARYEVEGEAWQVMRFDELAAEFDGLGAERLPEFHLILRLHARAWTLVRRLFGMRPVVPTMAHHPDDLRVWERAELRAAWDLSAAQLTAELSAARGLVSDLLRAPTVAPAAPAAVLESPERKGELNLAPVSSLLKKFRIHVGSAELEDREWLEGRARAYEQVLNVPMAEGLARTCLQNEWQIYIIEKEISDPIKCTPGLPNWVSLTKTKATLADSHTKNFAELMKLCPWAGRLAGQYDFRGVLSDLTAAILAYEARGDTQLVDGMFTGLEIQVELRRSVQAPEVRYRAGLVLYVNAARQNLFNPDWNPDEAGLTPGALRVFDEAWKAAAAEVLNAQGAPVVDLQAEGAAGEYPALKLKT